MVSLVLVLLVILIASFHTDAEHYFLPRYFRYSVFIVLIPIGVGGELLGQYIIQSLYANRWNYFIPQVGITIGYRHLIILMMLGSAQGKIVIITTLRSHTIGTC